MVHPFADEGIDTHKKLNADCEEETRIRYFLKTVSLNALLMSKPFKTKLNFSNY